MLEPWKNDDVPRCHQCGDQGKVIYTAGCHSAAERRPDNQGWVSDWQGSHSRVPLLACGKIDRTQMTVEAYLLCADCCVH